MQLDTSKNLPSQYANIIFDVFCDVAIAASLWLRPQDQPNAYLELERTNRA